MAKLKANGTEIVRGAKTTEDSDCVRIIQLSFRSNGWVLRKVNTIWKENDQKSPGRWRRCIRWNKELTKQEITDILKRKGYEAIS